MRRKDREVTDPREIAAILEKCDTVRIALNDNGYPYIVPVCFGEDIRNGVLSLYFHCAAEGKKLDLIKKDPRAGFEADTSRTLVTDDARGFCTMRYESVIGTGRIFFVPESDRLNGLKILMRHYHDGEFSFDTAAVPRTEVLRLEVGSITAKRNI